MAESLTCSNEKKISHPLRKEESTETFPATLSNFITYEKTSRNGAIYLKVSILKMTLSLLIQREDSQSQYRKGHLTNSNTFQA